MSSPTSQRASAFIRVQQLTKTFHDPKRGDVNAVDHISFEVGAGEIFGLLGPNGAGKTTALRLLATLLKPTAGTAVLGGYDILAEPGKVRQQIGFLAGETGLYARLTPREILRFFGEMQRMERRHAATPGGRDDRTVRHREVRRHSNGQTLDGHEAENRDRPDHAARSVPSARTTKTPCSGRSARASASFEKAKREPATLTVGIKLTDPAIRGALERAGIRTAESSDPRAGIEKKTVVAGVEEAAAGRPPEVGSTPAIRIRRRGPPRTRSARRSAISRIRACAIASASRGRPRARCRPSSFPKSMLRRPGRWRAWCGAACWDTSCCC